MGKTLADLQSNISISANNAVTGDIEWCSGYTQFSTDIGEQAGWYLALQVTTDIEDATVTAAYNGTIRELDNNIYIIRLADGEDTITFTAEKEGYTTGRLTLDLSGLNKETITNYCYVTSLTNGVTVTPLQFGESKILSGVVPYDTTTSSNHFRLKYRTFIPIPAGSQISVSHFGTELGTSTFNTVTPQEGEPYSEAEVEITITQEILDSQSPDLTTLIIPDTGEVLDRFYCSLGVENLTLQADPTPKMSVTSNTNSLTILPLGYASSKTATGTIPSINQNDSSGRVELRFSYLNVSASRYNIAINASNGDQIYFKSNLNSRPASAIIDLSSQYIGTPTSKLTILIYDATGTDLLVQSELDVSQVSILNPEYNITSSTSGITVTPSNYSTTKTFSGVVPYDTSTNTNKLTVVSRATNLRALKYTYVEIRSGNSTGTVLQTGTTQGTVRSLGITLDSTNVTNGLYIIVGEKTGQADPTYVTIAEITVDTSALTLEPAPAPAIPTLAGFQVGDGPYVFNISPNYSTYYSLNQDAFCCIDINYTGTDVDSSNHTVYEYSATGDSTTAVGYTGIKLLQSQSSGSPWFSVQNLQTSEIQDSVFLIRDRSNLAGSQPTTGDFIYQVPSSNIVGENPINGTTCNAFIVFYVDNFNNSDYHYVWGTNYPDAAQDISSKYGIYCCIYQGTADALQTGGIQVRLYNSDLSDYIVLDIDLSNVTFTTLP